MQRINFNFDWQRKLENGLGFFVSSRPTQTVHLPDDYVINLERSADAISGAPSGFFPGGTACYIKKFDLPSEWKDKTVLLGVDGAYMNSEVVLNAEHLIHHPYGYTPFFADLTPWLKDANTLKISTQNRQPNSRWYSGGGIYRSVEVLLGDRLYIHPWSVFVTTPQVSEGSAVVRIQAAVTSTLPRAETVTLRAEVTAPNGAVSIGTAELTAAANGETMAIILVDAGNPQLWDVDDPNLYSVKLEVLFGGEVTDTHLQTFGIRTIEIDAKNGMRLNGKSIKLRGGCIHHDNTLLGAAAFPAAEERKIRLLKEAGYNAIRCAHNPPSSAMLDVCDRLGMLVMDESFDCWLTGKNGNDYHLWFREWWERDTRAMVLRDRNHPSIFCWSIGNEVNDFTGSDLGVECVKMQADLVRSLDPTRPVTSAIHSIPNVEKMGLDFIEDFFALQGSADQGNLSDKTDIWGAQTERAFSHLDIAGYNYIWQRYASDAKKYPHRVIIGTETHPLTMYDYWQATLENPNVLGDFIWTAYDNLGEAGAGRVRWDVNDFDFMGRYPWLSCYQGDLDLDGNRRPQSFYHKILWGLDDGVHLFTLHPSRTGKPFGGTGWHWYDVRQEWTFDPQYNGQPVTVQAYCDCEKVEFVLNGTSVGFAIPEKNIATFDIAYQAGILEAIGYRDGRQSVRTTLATTGKPTHVVVIPERNEIAADGSDLAFLRIELRDDKDALVTCQPVEVSVTVEGAATLAGLGSGNPCTEENYGTGKRVTWNGVALAVVRAGCQGGTATVTVSADGLQSGSATVTIR